MQQRSSAWNSVIFVIILKRYVLALETLMKWCVVARVWVMFKTIHFEVIPFNETVRLRQLLVTTDQTVSETITFPLKHHPWGKTVKQILELILHISHLPLSLFLFSGKIFCSISSLSKLKNVNYLPSFRIKNGSRFSFRNFLLNGKKDRIWVFLKFEGLGLFGFWGYSNSIMVKFSAECHSWSECTRFPFSLYFIESRVQIL